MKPQAAGIDLGMTYSVIAVLDERGRPVVIPNAEGHLTTPSVVCFNQGRPVVGEEAKQAQALGDENVASFFKRWMGNSEYSVTLGDRDWTPVELSAQVFTARGRCRSPSKMPPETGGDYRSCVFRRPSTSSHDRGGTSSGTRSLADDQRADGRRIGARAETG